MKTLVMLAALLALFSLPVYADPLDDHRAALRAANAEFTADFERCDNNPPSIKARNKCRGQVKQQHTKAVQRADRELDMATRKAAKKQ